MTTAWWEDDEIECVWLGEGRIEHKPVLRKITIFSRWVKLFLLNMWNPYLIQSWRLTQTHVWVAEGGSPRLCYPVARWLNEVFGKKLEFYILSSCSSVNSFFLRVCQLQDKPQESKAPKKDPTNPVPWLIFIYSTDRYRSRRCIKLRRRISMTFTLRRKPFPSPRPQPSNPLSSSKMRENSQTDHPLKPFQFWAAPIPMSHS